MQSIKNFFVKYSDVGMVVCLMIGMISSEVAIKNATKPKDRASVIMAGIAYVESSTAKDPYRLVSRPSKNGDRAYGKYQIMGKYIPIWSREILGQTLTIDQFLKNPGLQDQVTRGRIQGLIEKGYSDQDIASIWFSGRPMAKAGNSKDVYGTTVPMYVKKFNSGVAKYLK